MILDDRAAYGETQSQAAESTRAGDPALLHDVKDSWQDRWVNADACVADLDDKARCSWRE